MNVTVSVTGTMLLYPLQCTGVRTKEEEVLVFSFNTPYNIYSSRPTVV